MFSTPNLTGADIALIAMLSSIVLFWLLIIVAIVFTVRNNVCPPVKKEKEKFALTAENLMDLD